MGFLSTLRVLQIRNFSEEMIAQVENNQRQIQMIRRIEHSIEKAHHNPTCLYPGCTKTPIGSHVIARKILNMIADAGHVWMWPVISAWDLRQAREQGLSLDHCYKEPKLVGIHRKNKVTEPLFCESHDSEVFKEIENTSFTGQPKQIALLAYRTLCSMTLEVSMVGKTIEQLRRQKYQPSFEERRQFQHLQRFQNTDLMRNIRQYYVNIIINDEYDQLEKLVCRINISPCIAATYCFIPYDAQAIINGNRPAAVKDVISFSFLPDEQSSDKSICIFSWLKGSQMAERFIIENNIKDFSEMNEQEFQPLFMGLALESPTLYISPQWWSALSDESKEQIKEKRFQVSERYGSWL